MAIDDPLLEQSADSFLGIDDKRDSPKEQVATDSLEKDVIPEQEAEKLVPEETPPIAPETSAETNPLAEEVAPPLEPTKEITDLNQQKLDKPPEEDIQVDEGPDNRPLLDFTRIAEAKVNPEAHEFLHADEAEKSFFGPTVWETIKDVGGALYKSVGDVAISTAEVGQWVGEQGYKLSGIAPIVNYLAPEAGERMEQAFETNYKAFEGLSKGLDEAIPTETGLGEAAGVLGQFGAAIFGAGKYKSGIEAITKTPMMLSNMTKTSMAALFGFDEHAANLGNVLEKFPELKGPVTEFLGKQDDDGIILGRVKNLVDIAVGGLAGAVGGAAVKGGAKLTAQAAQQISEGLTKGIESIKYMAPWGWTAKGTPKTYMDFAEDISTILPVKNQKSFLDKMKTAGDITKGSADMIVMQMQSFMTTAAHPINILGNTSMMALRLSEKAVARGITILDKPLRGALLGGKPGVAPGEVSAMFSGALKGAAMSLKEATAYFKAQGVRGALRDIGAPMESKATEAAKKLKAVDEQFPTKFDSSEVPTNLTPDYKFQVPGGKVTPKTAPADYKVKSNVEIVQSPLERLYADRGSKLDYPIGAGAHTLNVDPNSKLGKFADAWGNWGINPNFKALGKTDDTFRRMNYLAEYNSQLQSRAYNSGLRGADLDAQVAKWQNKPPEGVIEAALKESKRNVFQADPEWFGKAAMGFRGAFGPLGKVTVPFFNTLNNISKEKFQRFPPTALLFREAWSDLGAGGAQAAERMAKINTGVMMLGLTWGLEESGLWTGAIDAKDRATADAANITEYSGMIMGNRFSYKDLDVTGGLMRLSSDLKKTIGDLMDLRDDGNDKDIQDVLIGGALLMSSAVIDSTWGESAVETLAAFTGSPDDEGDKRQFRKFLEGKAISAVVPNIVRRAATSFDQHVRELTTFVDKLKASVPGLSPEFPIKYDVYGRDRTPSRQGVSGMLMPVGVRYETEDKFDNFLFESEVRIAPPTYTQSFSYGPNESAKLDLREHPRIYSEMNKFIGELPHPDYEDRTLSQHLEWLTTGDHPEAQDFKDLSNGPDGQKQIEVNKIINDYRKQARAHLLENDPELQTILDAELRLKEEQALLMEKFNAHRR